MHMKIKKQQGFTLLELLVTITIIGIISTIAFAAVNAARENARQDKARGDLKQLQTAILVLGSDTGEWPGHQPAGLKCSENPSCSPTNEICGDGCTFGLSDEESGLRLDDSFQPYTLWTGPYVRQIPNDPWGNEYFMDTDYTHAVYGDIAVVGSYGPNGVGNDLYDSDDIILILKR